MENQIAVNKEMIDGLIKKNLEKVFGFAMRRTEDSSEAEDLTQDIFLEVYKSYEKIKYYEGIEKLEAWLWTIAKYTYYKWLGKRGKNSITYIEGIKTEKLSSESNIDEKNKKLYRKNLFAWKINCYHTRNIYISIFKFLFKRSNKKFT